MTIEGKVAAILNNREVIINRGSDNGVEVEMRFKISDRSLDIKDPDTKKDLGHFTREKISVEIIEVQPLFSVGRTYETYRETVQPFAQITGVFSPRQVTRVRTIRTKDELLFSEDSANVAEGDPVTQLVTAQTANQT